MMISSTIPLTINLLNSFLGVVGVNFNKNRHCWVGTLPIHSAEHTKMQRLYTDSMQQHLKKNKLTNKNWRINAYLMMVPYEEAAVTSVFNSDTLDSTKLHPVKQLWWSWRLVWVVWNFLCMVPSVFDTQWGTYRCFNCKAFLDTSWSRYDLQ